MKDTIKLARDFAATLRGGEVVGLVGELGSGKTVFTKGLAEAFGVPEDITSPTFVILKKYRGKIGKRPINLIHVDAYRIERVEDIKSTGLEDYFGRPDTVVVIEWAEKIKQILPKSTIYIEFKHLSEDSRQIIISA